MTAYVIRGALVTAVGSASLTLSEGEISIGSAQEIEASGLSRVQLAAIWDALPGTNRLRTVSPRPGGSGRRFRNCRYRPSWLLLARGPARSRPRSWVC